MKPFLYTIHLTYILTLNLSIEYHLSKLVDFQVCIPHLEIDFLMNIIGSNRTKFFPNGNSLPCSPTIIIYLSCTCPNIFVAHLITIQDSFHRQDETNYPRLSRQILVRSIDLLN